MAKNLAVFDFDHTIIYDNSDTAVIDLLQHKKIPKELKSLHRSDGWTAFMQGVFKLLFENNVTEDAIGNLIKALAPIKGMCNLIKVLNCDLNYDVIVLSDSNSYFIKVWLEENDLHKHVFKVFTNPAVFEDGLLTISMYHLQTECKLSTKNLCKGKILDNFLEEQKILGSAYSKVIYCGDGANDFCPILRLKENHLACIRSDYKCHDLIKKTLNGKHLDDHGSPYKLLAKVFVWNDADEILDFIKNHY